MSARASNAIAILAAQRLAPLQLQQAQLAGQREAARHAAGLSALDKLISAAPQLASLGYDALITQPVAAKIAAAQARALEGGAGEAPPPLPTTAEGPPEQIPVEPVPTEVPARPGIAAEVPGIAPAATKVVDVEQPPLELPPAPPAPVKQPRYARSVYDETQKVLDDAGLTRRERDEEIPFSDGPARGPTGKWWDPLWRPIENEQNRIAREQATLPVAKAIKAERDALRTLEIKAATEAADRANQAEGRLIQWAGVKAAMENAKEQRALNAQLAASNLGQRQAETNLAHADRQAALALQAQGLAMHDATARYVAELNANARDGTVPQKVLDDVNEGMKHTANLREAVDILTRKRKEGKSISGVFTFSKNWIEQRVPGLDPDPEITKAYQKIATYRNALTNQLFGAAVSKQDAAARYEQMPSFASLNDDTFLLRVTEVLNDTERDIANYLALVNANRRRPVEVPNPVVPPPTKASPPPPTTTQPAPVQILGAPQNVWSPQGAALDEILRRK